MKRKEKNRKRRLKKAAGGLLAFLWILTALTACGSFVGSGDRTGDGQSGGSLVGSGGQSGDDQTGSGQGGSGSQTGSGQGGSGSQSGDGQDGSGGSEERWAYVPELLTLDGEKPGNDLRLFRDSLYRLKEEAAVWTLCRYSLTDQADPGDGPLPMEELVLHPLREASEETAGRVLAFAVGADGSVCLIESPGTLYRFDAAGEEIFAVPLETSGNSWYLQVDEEGTCYCAGGNTVTCYDKEGNLRGSLSLKNQDSLITGLSRSREGKLYALSVISQNQGGFVIIGSDTCQLTELDFQAGKTTEAETELTGYQTDCLAPGLEEDFLVYNSTGVYDYRLDGQEASEVLRWLDCDIDGTFASLVGVLGDGRILVYCRDTSARQGELTLLTERKITPDMERQILTLGTLSPKSSALMAQVVGFNKRNKEYRIEIQGYYDETAGESRDDALRKLQNALLSQDPPDLIDLAGLDVAQYAKKGIFADLSPYLEQGGALKKEDFLENILQEYTMGGRLVAIPGRFSVATVAGSAAELAGASWTLEDVIAYAGKHPGKELFADARKSSILEFLLLFGRDAFWDLSGGECHFDTEEFQKLLQFINQFPDTDGTGMMMTSGPARIQAGEVLLTTATETNLNSFQLYQAMFPDGAVYVGYPTVDGNGGHRITNVSQIYGISSRSDCPDGAWEFIESVFLHEDDLLFVSGFPTLRRTLEKEAEEALVSGYALDENGEVVLDENGEPVHNVEIGYVYWSMDWTYSYRVPTKEEVDAVLELIGKARLASDEDEEILEILNEEAEAFYRGQKTAEEVAKVIQSRVSLYLSELE